MTCSIIIVKTIRCQFTRNYLSNILGKDKIFLSKQLVKLVLLYQINQKELPLVFNWSHNSKQHCNQHCMAP